MEEFVHEDCMVSSTDLQYQNQNHNQNTPALRRVFPPRRLTQIPARPRARDTRATETVPEFPMIMIIPNLGPCTYLPSPKTLYENPGHAEPQSWR